MSKKIDKIELEAVIENINRVFADGGSLNCMKLSERNNYICIDLEYMSTKTQKIETKQDYIKGTNIRTLINSSHSYFDGLRDAPTLK